MTGLATGTDYTFQVRIVGGGNASEPDEVTATTTGTAVSTDATLSALVVNDGSTDLTLTPGFAPDEYTYMASVGTAVDEVTVTPTPNDAGAMIEYLDGSDITLTDAGTAAGHQVAVAEGDNVVKVSCWNESGGAAAGTRALKARFVSPPEHHDGSGRVKVRVAFSEAIEESPENVGEHGVKVEGGRVTSVRQVDNQPAGGAGALSATISTTVLGPVALSVADARVREAGDALLVFEVTLGRARHAAVTVDYVTSDVTARAGEDYTSASGTLTFATGERLKTVEVTVLDDAHDEGEETLTLTLSNASGARSGVTPSSRPAAGSRSTRATASASPATGACSRPTQA